MDTMAPPQTTVRDHAVWRVRLTLRGAVQGVGFRPFIYRLANTLGLVGWVCNTAQGVCIEAEGSHRQLEQFLIRIDGERPPHVSIHRLEASWLAPVGYTTFEIRDSDVVGEKTALGRASASSRRCRTIARTLP
jgi:hydrogenase maturation protein HypF